MIFLDTCILIDYSKDKIALDFTKNYCISSSSTCLVYDLPLWTYNRKDFKFIDGVNLV